MRSISEIKGEDALDVLADIIEPVSEILTDKEVVEHARAGDKIKAVSAAIKNHKKEVIKVLAILDGENPETYAPSILTLPVMLINLLNDPDIGMLFTPQGQNTGENASGSVTENIEANEK